MNGEKSVYPSPIFFSRGTRWRWIETRCAPSWLLVATRFSHIPFPFTYAGIRAIQAKRLIVPRGGVGSGEQRPEKALVGGEQALIGNFLPSFNPRSEMPRVPFPSFFSTRDRIDLACPARATFSANFSQFNRNSDTPIPAFLKDIYNLRIRLIAILFVPLCYSSIYIYTHTRRVNSTPYDRVMSRHSLFESLHRRVVSLG